MPTKAKRKEMWPSSDRRFEPPEKAALPVVEGSSESDRELEVELRGRHWIPIAAYIAAIFAATSILHVRLPEPKAGTTDPREFSELRARRLVDIMSGYGPKPAGSYACEVQTKKFILGELEVIRTAATVKMEITLQNPSGCFDIPRFDTDGFTVCYKNVSNVAVRLTYDEKTFNDPLRVAVLLNCHFDSWPTSSGGSDDLVSCALMLELIRLLSRDKAALVDHDVIFLFNGAEESSLQGAHGFITQHPWRHVVRAFINLEASGSGGRELLFQAGPSNQWLLNSYLETAVYPHCSIIGQEVFQSGVFPGDTDFRVFRDYGRVPGLDLAFVQNGYWWHTEFDEARRITPGSIQRAGENIHATLLHLLQSPYLDNPAEYGDQKYVFFDVLGVFVVVYAESIGNAINAALVLTAFLKVANHVRRNSEDYKSAVIGYSIVFVTMTSVTLTITQLTILICGAMPWYSLHYLALLIYGLPTIWTGITTMAFLTANIEMEKREAYASAIENVHQSMVAVILAFLTAKGVSSGYIFALMLIPMAKGVAPGKKEWSTVTVHLVLYTPTYVMCVYLMSMFLSIFIPIMGQTGSNPELLVAIFTNFAIYAIVLSMLPLVVITKNQRQREDSTISNFLRMIGGILVTTSAMLAMIHLLYKYPYLHTDDYPMARRIQIFHANREFFNKDEGRLLKDSGIYVIAQDYRGAEDIPFVDGDYSQLKCIYDSPYCEIPLYFPTRNRIQDRHIRFRSLEDINLPETKVNLLQKTEYLNQLVYDFNIKGSGQMSVFIVPQSGYQVANCSLSAPRKENDDRPLFLFLTCNGDRCGEWTFRLTLASSSGRNTDEDSQLLLGVASHYLHGNYMQSNAIRRLLAEIGNKRRNDTAWAITASAWNVDLRYKYF
ncbi:hypothetical protein Q1695_011750 [Nippostrongylus brasiliensis]|nr:hypothetical protein Q1695_011750 [Nippostrongylus brasiliensis]